MEHVTCIHSIELKLFQDLAVEINQAMALLLFEQLPLLLDHSLDQRLDID